MTLSIYAGFGTFGRFPGELSEVPFFVIQSLPDPFFPFEIGPDWPGRDLAVIRKNPVHQLNSLLVFRNIGMYIEVVGDPDVGVAEHAAQNLDVHSGCQGSCGKGMTQRMDICGPVTVISGLAFVCACQSTVAAHAAIDFGDDEIVICRRSSLSTQQQTETLLGFTVQIDLTVAVLCFGPCNYLFLRHFAGLFVDSLNNRD